MKEIRKKQIGARIKLKRKETGYLQRELALHCTTISVRIGEFERGVTIPNTDMVIKLSIALDCTTDYLLKGI